MPLVVRSQLLSKNRFAHGFSTRQGGVSQGAFASLNLGRSVGDAPEHVAENLRRFAEEVGYESEALYELSQVHGNAVRAVQTSDEPAALRALHGDGLVAGLGRPIGVRTADCLALLLADPETRAVAALHSGWRGSVANIARVGVATLCSETGAPPSRLLAAVFPHIRSCCFEVREDVAEQLERAAVSCAPAGASATASVVDRSRDKPHVSLFALVRAQLVAAGVAGAHIDDVPGCTCCEPERFFSFRRDGTASGRHLAAIVSG